MNHVTYRIGEGKHQPIDRVGNEVDELTKLDIDNFISETEELLGRKISVLWMGTQPMPGPGKWLVCGLLGKTCTYNDNYLEGEHGQNRQQKTRVPVKT